MMRTMTVAAAFLVMAVAQPTDAAPGEPGMACHDTDNESGFGGTHVYCDFACDRNMPISVSVVAHDNDATSAIWSDCGEIKTDCDLGTQACTATSDELTLVKDEDDCHGRSYEAIDSSVTIACASVYINACGYIPDGLPKPPAVCERDETDPRPCDALLGPSCKLLDLLTLCVSANPGLAELDPEVLESLFPTTFGVVSTMVSAYFDGAGSGVVVRFGDSVCLSGSFSY